MNKTFPPKGQPPGQSLPEQQAQAAQTFNTGVNASLRPEADNGSAFNFQNEADWKKEVPTEIGSSARTGLLGVGVFSALFMAWATLMPLSGAVVALGSVQPTGQSKLLQHPSGGTIKEIFARDGDKVEQGQKIFLLDPVVNEAELTQLEGRLSHFEALNARLEAQLSGTRQPDFTFTFSTPEQNKIIANQRQEFQSAKEAHEQEIKGLHQQIDALNKRIRGRRLERSTMKKRASILGKQVAKMRRLANKGYIARNRLEELELRFSELLGNGANLSAEIASSKHQIYEIESRISQVKAASRKQISKELSQARAELTSLKSQIRAARNIVDKTEIKAPVAGTVSKSVVHTIGGVVQSGQTIAEIVPASSAQMVEVQIQPLDIASVKMGQKAEIVVTAFNQRLYDPIKGEVAYVAANAKLNEQTGTQYFVVRLRLNESVSKNNNIANLRAGMQANVFITTTSRPFMSYLLKPVSDSFRRAFREQ